MATETPNMIMPQVYIAQEPMRKDAAGQWVSKGYNLADATRFGAIKVVYPPGASVFADVLVHSVALRVAMLYDDKRDYIIAGGSPTLMMALAHAIGSQRKKLRILEWDRGMRSYYPTIT
jgi:thiamine pyrophosphate-dependent acetolactate synthase large subunit-like protein